MNRVTVPVLLAFVLIMSSTALSQQPGVFGLRGGIGTDIGGGIAYGATVLYMFTETATPLEVGLTIFGGSFEETTEEYHTYEETTDIFVVAVTGNWLFNYSTTKPGLFFTVGGGVGAISVEWEERSPTDGSLGTPYGDEGSKQSEEGTSAGLIASVGIGHHFGGGTDLRFEIPVFFILGAPGEATGVAPTFTLMLGLHF